MSNFLSSNSKQHLIPMHINCSTNISISLVVHLALAEAHIPFSVSLFDCRTEWIANNLAPESRETINPFGNLLLETTHGSQESQSEYVLLLRISVSTNRQTACRKCTHPPTIRSSCLPLRTKPTSRRDYEWSVLPGASSPKMYKIQKPIGIKSRISVQGTLITSSNTYTFVLTATLKLVLTRVNSSNDKLPVTDIR